MPGSWDSTVGATPKMHGRKLKTHSRQFQLQQHGNGGGTEYSYIRESARQIL
jgi:hypothetical protein